MSNQFGPWATLIDAGGNPQLSAFWRRRLTMLVPTSQTSPTLSRRNRLWLVAAAVLMLVLPTFRPAPAAEDPTGKTPSAAPGGASRTGAATQRGTYVGSTTVTASVGPSGKIVPVSETGEELDFFPVADRDLNMPVYYPLGYERARKDLGLSSQQEAKLRGISRHYSAERQAILEPLQKELAELPSIEHQTKIFAALKSLNKPIRKQVEEVLTPAQLTALKSLALSERAWELHSLDNQVHLTPRFQLSDEQMKEYHRLITQSMKESYRLPRENDEKSLAVLSPQQREQLERQVGQSDVLQLAFFRHPSFAPVPPAGTGTVFYLTLFKAMRPDTISGLTEEQQMKLRVILQSQPAQELYKLHAQLFGDVLGAHPEPKSANAQHKEPPKTAAKDMTKFSASGMVTIDMRSDTPGDSSPKLSMLEQRLAQHPKMQKKWKDSSNELRRQIEALFTPEQLATLKKIALQKLELQSLRNPRTLSELAATDQQKAELRRLHEEKTWIEWRVHQSTGAELLKLLTPQQREQFTRMLEHRDWSVMPDQ